MPVKPPIHRIAREAADVPGRWRWAWRDLFALVPLVEGSGGYRNLVTGEVATVNDGPVAMQDGVMGREAMFPGRTPWLEFTVGSVFPYLDGSVVVVGSDSGSSSAASWVSSRSSNPTGVWVDAECYNNTGTWGLGLGGVASYGSFATPTSARPVGVAWTSGGTARFFDRTYGGMSTAIGAATTPSLTGFAVGTTHYNSGRRGAIDGNITLVAALNHGDDAWVEALVADPFSWITRRRVFAFKPPAAPGGSSIGLLRANAGLGGGPFSLANAGVGAIA